MIVPTRELIRRLKVASLNGRVEIVTFGDKGVFSVVDKETRIACNSEYAPLPGLHLESPVAFDTKTALKYLKTCGSKEVEVLVEGAVLRMVGVGGLGAVCLRLADPAKVVSSLINFNSLYPDETAIGRRFETPIKNLRNLAKVAKPKTVKFDGDLVSLCGENGATEERFSGVGTCHLVVKGKDFVDALALVDTKAEFLVYPSVLLLVEDGYRILVSNED